MSRVRVLRSRVGRRGLFLLFLAVLDIIFGYFLHSPPPSALRDTFMLLPQEVWAWWWIGTGAACLVGAFMRNDRVPYALGALLLSAWGLRYAYLWYNDIPFAWVSLTIWLAFAFTVVVVAGWPEPPTRKVLGRWALTGLSRCCLPC